MPDEDKAEVTEKQEESQKPPEKSPAELLAEATAAIAAERAAREKAERDLSSLRGTVRSQRELEDRFDDQYTVIKKHLEILSRGIAKPDTVANIPAELAQVQAERSMTALHREYERLATEFAETVKGDDGKPVFDIDAAPELADARALWLQGKTSTTLSPDAKIALFHRAIAEAAKAKVAHERKVMRDERAAEKEAAAKARKAKVEENGELDLDTGAGAGATGPKLEDMTPTQKIAAGLAKARKEGKKSSLYG